MFKNLSPIKLQEILNSEMENAPFYPVMESQDSTSSVKIHMMDELLRNINPDDSKIEKKSFSFTGAAEHPITVEYSLMKTKWVNPVTRNKEVYHSLAGTENITLKELFELNIASRQLTMIAESALKIWLMTTPELKQNGIYLSGEYLYSNIVNPETFKYASDEILAMMSNNYVGDKGAINMSSEQLDQWKNTNYVLNVLGHSANLRFLKFCKENVKYAGENVVKSNVNVIKNSDAKAVIMKSSESVYTQVGSENVRDIKQATLGL